jgi:uncharacterized protein with GYD domain
MLRRCAHDSENACLRLEAAGTGFRNASCASKMPAAMIAWEECMPIYITQGRYTRDAVKGMIVKPEDRAEAVSRLLAKVGGRLHGYYLTFGEYDFLCIAELPSDTQAAAALLTVASGGGVTGLRTTVAMTSVEAKGAFAAASDIAPAFKSAGGT